MFEGKMWDASESISIIGSRGTLRFSYSALRLLVDGVK